MAAPSLAFGTGDWELAGFFTPTGQSPTYGTLFGGGGTVYSAGCVFIMQYGTNAQPASGRPAVKNKIGVGGFNVIGGSGENVNGNPLLYSNSESVVGTEYYIRVNVVAGVARLFIDEVLQGSAMATANPWNFFTIGYNTWGGANSYLNGRLNGWTVKTTGISTVPGAIPSAPKSSKFLIEVPSNTQLLDDVFNNGKSVVGNGAGLLGSGFSTAGVELRRLVNLEPHYVLGYNLEPQSPRRRLSAKGGAWRWETQTTGSGTISGVVTIENIPGSRKVRLYRKHDGMLIRETWSAANGAYSFDNLDPAWEYFVVAHDHLRVYNGVIQDMLVP